MFPVKFSENRLDPLLNRSREVFSDTRKTAFTSVFDRMLEKYARPAKVVLIVCIALINRVLFRLQTFEV
jgi:hypothetical protein